MSFFIFFSTSPVNIIYAADYTGMWWDPAKEGTGVFIEHIEESNCICGAWYLYDEEGNPFWMTFWGSLSGGSFSSDLFSFTGPGLGNSWDASNIKGFKEGEATFSFTSSATITMTYQVRGASGQLNLSRFSLDVCPGWLWWDPRKPGQGVALFHMIDDEAQDKVALAWYVYDSKGNPVWFTGTETYAGGDLEVFQFTGPGLGTSWDVSKLRRSNVGTISLDNIRGPQIDDGKLLTPLNLMTYSVQGVSGNLTLETFWCDSDI